MHACIPSPKLMHSLTRLFARPIIPKLDTGPGLVGGFHCMVLLMDKILHDLKDSKLWELSYIPYNG